MLSTVGHSNMSWDKFLALIEPVDTLIDVRSHPTSKWEQFRRESMADCLGNRYEWWPQLGGWTERHLRLPEETLGPIRAAGIPIETYATGKFPKQRIAKKIKPEETKPEAPCWTNVGLRDYSWLMTIDEFLSAADRLIDRARTEDVAIMCCEALYYKCHRSMIADYIVWRGHDATHIQTTKGRGKSHRTVIGNRIERYEVGVLDAWEEWRAKHLNPF